MKKALSILLACMFLVSFTATLASATDVQYQDGNFYYVKSNEYSPENDGYAFITGYKGTVPTHLIIPKTLGGRVVKGIEAGAFANNPQLNTITFYTSAVLYPKSFENCPNVKTFNIESSDIYFMFRHYDGNPFSGDFPTDFMVNIGKDVDFFETTTLTYYGDVMDYNFSISVHKDNPHYKMENDTLYSKDGKILYTCDRKFKDSTFIVPNTVEEICFRAFLGCKNIKTYVIPSSVKMIGEDSIGCVSGYGRDGEYASFYGNIIIKCVKDSVAHEYALERVSYNNDFASVAIELMDEEQEDNPNFWQRVGNFFTIIFNFLFGWIFRLFS